MFPTEKGLPPAVLPRILWDEVINIAHNFPPGGHRKFKKLYESIRNSFHFHQMYPYIQAHCHQCLDCQTTTRTGTLRSELNPIHTLQYPGLVIQLDCTPGPNKTRQGNTHILTIIDAFTGYLRLYPISQPEGRTSGSSLLQYVCVHSMPLKIITDNGSEFANELMTDLTNYMGIKQTLISPHHSQSNGKVEEIHRVIKTMIRAFIVDFKQDWDLLIPLLEFAYNTSQSSVTQYTPFFLFYGRHPIMPIDTLYGTAYRPATTVNEYVTTLKQDRDRIIEWVKHQKEQAANQYKNRYER